MTLSRKPTALAYGAACHVLRCAAIAPMAAWRSGGMPLGPGPFRGWAGELRNLRPVAQSPIIRSFFLSRSGRRVLRALAPRGLGSDPSSTADAILAFLRLLAAFAPSWLLLAESMRESGLGVPPGYLG